MFLTCLHPHTFLFSLKLQRRFNFHYVHEPTSACVCSRLGPRRVAFAPTFLLFMSLHHTVKGQCGSCGKGNRSLLPPEADGHSYCVVCSLLVSIQQMTTRIDSETDHRIVRLYQELVRFTWADGEIKSFRKSWFRQISHVFDFWELTNHDSDN